MPKVRTVWVPVLRWQALEEKTMAPALPVCPVGSISLANLLEGGLVSAGNFDYFIISIAGEVLLHKLKNTVRVSKRGVFLYVVRLSRVRLISPGCLVILAAIPP
jgi:hypothetical protein